MHFYRSLYPISAITFDLDDTLYDNGPVIRKTLEVSHQAMCGWHQSLRHFSLEAWQAELNQLRAEEPEIYHDVTEWRRRAVVQVMMKAGLGNTEAENGAREVMSIFAHWRSQVAIAPEILTTLTALAGRFPLVAITNGNAEPALFGLQKYFQFVLRAGPDGRAKPYSDMFRLAAQRLNLSPKQILHVGDDLTADVAGAIHSGMQACWIKPNGVSLKQSNASCLMPTLEITQLASLRALVFSQDSMPTDSPGTLISP